MIFLDTNVISELTRPMPSARVARWIDSQQPGELATASVVEMELLYGLLSMPVGRRRRVLIETTERIVNRLVGNRIHPFDRKAARHFAESAIVRKSAGMPLNQFDGMIAATALSVGAAVATRDISDFAGLGLALVNPWEFAS